MVVGVVAPQQRSVAGPAAQDRRAGGGRWLWRPVDRARTGALRHRRHRARARRLRRRRLDAQRRRGQRRHHHGQGVLGQGRRRRSRGLEEDHAAHAHRRRGFACPGRDGDPARGHRVLLAHERSLQRRLYAAAFCRTGGQGRDLQQHGRARHLHGPARTAARGDRLGLLLRRHGGRAHGPAPPRALLRRLAEGREPRRRHALRKLRCREDRAQDQRLYGPHHQGPDRGARGGDRDQRESCPKTWFRA